MPNANPTPDEICERLRAPAFWCCESDEGHPGDATALVHEAADLIKQQQATIERLSAALEPFADFANLSGAAYLPDDHVITLGSGMAARQLTMGDCRKARAALGKDASDVRSQPCAQEDAPSSDMGKGE